MKKLFLVLFLILLSIPEFGYSQDSIVSGKSQNRHSGFSVSIEAGLSPCFGLYSMGNDAWSGGECASQGGAVSINCDYRFKKQKLELTAAIGYNRNNYDMSNFIKYEEYPDGNNTAYALVTNPSATGYNTGYFSAGFKRPFYLGKFTFYLNAMPGFLLSNTPAISYTIKSLGGNDSIPWKVTQPSEIGFAFILSVGAGIEYHITKNMFVLVSGAIGVSLNSIKVTNNSTEPANFQGYPVPDYSSYLYMQTDNLEMGVGYEF